MSVTEQAELVAAAQPLRPGSALGAWLVGFAVWLLRATAVLVLASPLLIAAVLFLR